MSASMAVDQQIRSLNPLNAETSVHSMIGGVAMPTERFYVRNHFQMPALDPSRWRLHVGGARLLGDPSRHSWQRWVLITRLNPSGSAWATARTRSRRRRFESSLRRSQRTTLRLVDRDRQLDLAILDD